MTAVNCVSVKEKVLKPWVQLLESAGRITCKRGWYLYVKENKLRHKFLKKISVVSLVTVTCALNLV